MFVISKMTCFILSYSNFVSGTSSRDSGLSLLSEPNGAFNMDTEDPFMSSMMMGGGAAFANGGAARMAGDARCRRYGPIDGSTVDGSTVDG